MVSTAVANARYGARKSVSHRVASRVASLCEIRRDYEVGSLPPIALQTFISVVKSLIQRRHGKFTGQSSVQFDSDLIT